MGSCSPDRDALERARRGDRRAFAEVVDACGGLVLNLAFRMVRDRAEAEDLSQEVLLRLWRALPRYDPSRPFLPWLRKVAMNQMLNLCTRGADRARRRVESLDARAEATGESPADPSAPTGPGRAEARERADAVRRAVARLDPDHRAILALRYFGGESYEDLARGLSLPLGTVKNRLFRARAALAEELRGFEEGGR